MHLPMLWTSLALPFLHSLADPFVTIAHERTLQLESVLCPDLTPARLSVVSPGDV